MALVIMYQGDTQHNPGPHHYDITIIMYQGEKEEKERLELEEKREKVIAPTPSLVQQARLDTLPSVHDAAWPARYGARPS